MCLLFGFGPLAGSYRFVAHLCCLFFSSRTRSFCYFPTSCGSCDQAMKTKRLTSSWRISETIAGRFIKMLVIRDYLTQKILFVFRFFVDPYKPTKWKLLRQTSQVTNTMAAPSRRWKLLLGADDQPLVPMSSCTTSSRRKTNRVKSGRNLLPALRSKLRPRVRQREKVQSVGRWNPLWRGCTEKEDLERMTHILEAQFRLCKAGFSAIFEEARDDPVESRCWLQKFL